MGISQKTQKIVWGLAAARCSYPDCRIELVREGRGGDPFAVVGEIAHIVARKARGPRGDSTTPDHELNDPSNLLLLCGNHHKLVDDQPKTHTVEVLQRYKLAHESWVRENLKGPLPSTNALAHPLETFAEDTPRVEPAKLVEIEEEFVRMRRRVTAEPGDASAWQALARAQYYLRLYPDALESLERARALAGSSDSLDRLRASILTDSSHSEVLSERTGLFEAREIFTRLAEDSDEWGNHYDLGNVLKALADDEGAVQAYEKAISLDGGQAEVWCNLATVQHRLGRHSEELESFNRALELNPDLPEALAGKGSTLLVDHNDGPSAAKLLQRAIEAAPERWAEWLHIWFWLAEAHRIAEDAEQALNVANEGLLRAPSDRYLLNLKATLLSQLARDDASYCSEAISFYRSLIELSPYDYGRRGELLELMEQTGDEDGAWELLEEIFPLIGLDLGEIHLCDLGVSLHACYHGLRLLPNYATYRLQFPVEKYWDKKDELMLDFSQLPRLATKADQLLTAASAVAFGVYFESLIGKASEYPSLDVLRSSYKKSADILLRSCPFFTTIILENEYQDGATEGKMPVLELPRFIADTLLREISRLTGWINGRLGISEALRMKLANSEEAADFHESTTRITFGTTLLVAESRERG